MNQSLNGRRLLAMIGAIVLFAGTTAAQEEPFRFAGTTGPAQPKVTEELVKLMLSAKGGKIQQSH